MYLGTGYPGVSTIASTSGFPLGPYSALPGSMRALDGVMPSLLQAPRPNFSQVVNVARSARKFKGDDDLDEEGVITWAVLKGKFITRYRGDINLIMVLDNLTRVQHKKRELVLAYINWFRTKAKWLPQEEANSPVAVSHFLRNM
ncbi:hypothetical protein R1flu_021161 [Riccia fluitans]|uniref:Chromo domain-containing protein n=1 Tax=Riccia fluitans TaxID=41844 RepID=A0ABD1ZNK3_9MARC